MRLSSSACLVTRGDVDLSRIIESIAAAGIEDIVVWDNSQRDDLAVYGRYAAIEEAKYDLIYVQDDDCVLKAKAIRSLLLLHEADSVVCNMPTPFRYAFYEEHALVGFGACFHRDAPEEAFSTFWTAVTLGDIGPQGTDFFERTCDIVFTALTPRIRVDLPYKNLPWASADDRMWKQPTHQEERSRMLELVKQVRDAA